MKDKDPLGDRMKGYEKQYDGNLMDLLPICARIDGRCFHSFTAGLNRPYDLGLQKIMIETTKYLINETNALIGYTQSDEISLIWYHDKSEKSQLFFGGRIMKLNSMLSSMATAFFNKNLSNFIPSKSDKMPMFDSRIWQVPNKTEAANYLYWREADAIRNSISMAAQHYYSHNQLHKKTSSEKKKMLLEKGVVWENYPDHFKKGCYLRKSLFKRKFTSEEIEKLPLKHEARLNPDLLISRCEVCEIEDIPLFKNISNKKEFIFDLDFPLIKD